LTAHQIATLIDIERATDKAHTRPGESATPGRHRGRAAR
jgi:hypothetical protein